MADQSATPQVTRTIRAALRLGEDAVTLEASLTLPLNADEAQIEQALQLSQRMHELQYSAFTQQINRVREGFQASALPADSEAPAGDRQRNLIAALQEDHGWTDAQTAAFAHRHGCDLRTLTRRQATALIEALRRSPDERAADTAQPLSVRPALPRQRHALEKLATQRSADLAAEIVQRFSCSIDQLSADQAAQLLQEWQALPSRQRFETAR